jgi:hypothetical protein
MVAASPHFECEQCGFCILVGLDCQAIPTLAQVISIGGHRLDCLRWVFLSFWELSADDIRKCWIREPFQFVLFSEAHRRTIRIECRL